MLDPVLLVETGQASRDARGMPGAPACAAHHGGLCFCECWWVLVRPGLVCGCPADYGKCRWLFRSVRPGLVSSSLLARPHLPRQPAQPPGHYMPGALPLNEHGQGLLLCAAQLLILEGFSAARPACAELRAGHNRGVVHSLQGGGLAVHRPTDASGGAGCLQPCAAPEALHGCPAGESSK